MRYIFYLFLILLSACMPSKKVYLCGDMVCANKKEATKYFSKNLTVEVIKEKNKEFNEINLIELNKTIESKKNKSSIKNEKKLLKEEIQKERKKIKREKKIAKLNLKKEKKRLNEIKNKDKKIFKLKRSNSQKNIQKKIKPFSKVVINKQSCLITKDCDIDVITETLNKVGKSKDFPNISE